MAVKDQCVTDRYALYNGDCVEVMADIPDGTIHHSIYSPPFAGLYHYSSDERDLSNNDNYQDFIEHYAFVVRELSRITMPGRITAVHCMDIPRTNNGSDRLLDFPGDVIRLHEREGWAFTGRRMIWKEPLGVRMRTMQKSLAHQALVEDSIDCGVASGDQLLTFRRAGENPVPVAHPVGMLEYSGARVPPADVLPFRGHAGKQTENRFSHWIWRQYASCIWDDVREKRVLPYREARDSDDEKHLHPLQLDVIDRCVALFSNPGEVVFTPFMGVGSEVFSPLLLGRRAIGTELKSSYYRQAVKNARLAADGRKDVVVNEELDFAQAGDMG